MTDNYENYLSYLEAIKQGIGNNNNNYLLKTDKPCRILYTSNSKIIPSNDNFMNSNYQKLSFINIYNPSTKEGYLEFDEQVTVIGSSAFYAQNDLTTIIIPDGVRTIQINAFYNCQYLNSIQLPDSVIDIRTNVFDGCQSLKTIVLPKNIEIIEGGTFKGCQSLNNIVIPSKVKNINQYAFTGCISLENITIPDNVESIGVNTFAYCSGLQIANIGSGILGIGSGAFKGCTQLESINYNGFINDWNEIVIDVDWNKDILATSVSCIDGIIELN